MSSTLWLDRRCFIRIAAGAAAAWPIPMRAEDGAAPTIGFIDPRSSPDPFATQFAAFQRGLKSTGFVEGENLRIEYRWGANQFDKLRALAEELAEKPLSVIVASGGSHVPLVVQATATKIPVVFVVADDPVKLGLVANLAHPGYNLTGINYFNAELYAKRLELLHQMVPNAVRVAVLVNPNDPTTSEFTLNEVEAAAPPMGLSLQVLKASTDREIEATLKSLHEHADALYIGGDAFLHSRRSRITELASENGVPAAYPQREWVEVGGLMSYGTSFPEIYRQLGVYVGRILNGEKPAQLPVVQPSNFELVFNLKTANALGITIAPTLIALADDVIEE